MRRIFRFKLARLVGYVALALAVIGAWWGVATLLVAVVNSGGATQTEIVALYTVDVMVNVLLLALLGKGTFIVGKRLYWKVYMRWSVMMGRRVHQGYAELRLKDLQ